MTEYNNRCKIMMICIVAGFILTTIETDGVIWPVNCRQVFKGSSMEKEQKQIWVAHDEPRETRAKAVVISAIILLGIAAFLTCIYSIIPALLS
jgi:hypothetical protein